VELRTPPGVLELVIRDNGVGFDVTAARRRAVRGGSLGLLGLEERVELAGGRVTIDSSPRGTRICARFPMAGRP
jgi:signal transduction histidine kinase